MTVPPDKGINREAWIIMPIPFFDEGKVDDWGRIINIKGILPSLQGLSQTTPRCPYD